MFTLEHTLVHMVEYLLELALRDIDQPFWLFPNTHISPATIPPSSVYSYN
jgi:hypothetical protein